MFISEEFVDNMNKKLTKRVGEKNAERLKKAGKIAVKVGAGVVGLAAVGAARRKLLARRHKKLFGDK